jgi:hypothetical protein
MPTTAATAAGASADTQADPPQQEKPDRATLEAWPPR